MATLNIKSFATIVRDQATAIQARATALIDFNPGSILLSAAQASAGVVLWLQGLILQLLSTTRAATSTGADLDSFVNDYGLTRLSATPAAGLVTFTRFTPTSAALVPIGERVQTADFTQTFTVTIDLTNPAYNAAMGGYLLTPTVASVTVPVLASNPSAASNVQANTVSVIEDAIIGVDTVNNTSAFAGGTDGESDAQLRVRFRAYLASVARGTVSAIDFAISSVQLGINFANLENVDYSLASDPGHLTIVVDDGTGFPPTSLLNSVYMAVDAYRAEGITFGVFAPMVETADVALTVGVVAGYDVPTVQDAVQAAITKYLNTLPIGQGVSYTRLAQVAYDASPGVATITALLLNSGTSDVSITAVQVIKVGTVTV